MSVEGGPAASPIYEFRVHGRLPEQSRDAFCGMDIEEVPASTVLRGPVIDESHLLGILSELRRHGLGLVSAHPLPPGRTGAG